MQKSWGQTQKQQQLDHAHVTQNTNYLKSVVEIKKPRKKINKQNQIFNCNVTLLGAFLVTSCPLCCG